MVKIDYTYKMLRTHLMINFRAILSWKQTAIGFHVEIWMLFRTRFLTPRLDKKNWLANCWCEISTMDDILLKINLLHEDDIWRLHSTYIFGTKRAISFSRVSYKKLKLEQLFKNYNFIRDVRDSLITVHWANPSVSIRQD